MGTYTALHFNAALRKDTPTEVIHTLQFMTGESSQHPVVPDHPLFHASRWNCMLQMSSYYFRAVTNSYVHKVWAENAYWLSITCNLKNYDDEIGKFLDWIMAYVDAHPGEWLGYTMGEEDEQPTLIFYPEN